MTMISCSQCRKKFVSSRSICPFCQYERPAGDQGAKQRLPDALKKGCGVLVVAFIGFTALVAIFGKNEPTKSKPSASSPSTMAADQKAMAKGAALQMLQQVYELARDCDASGKQMSEAIQSGNVVDAYRAADQAENICLPIGNKMADIEVPDSITEAEQKQAKDAIEACQATYLARWEGARSMKTALDGDQRASVLANIQDNAETVSRGTFACVGPLIAIASKYGASDQELGIKSTKK